ncbi:MAG: AmmeMemoRadiSam system radical SAM enzyme [Lachnospiraceae bacterium]|nr:AmmeMemoRadiSam system radical SAM enzyme [Lachnospiraceae bacterium]
MTHDLQEDRRSTECICEVCAHHCRLSPGQTGRCLARQNRDGKIISLNYGIVTSLALDPIEKKPLNRFCPGSRILSVGSFGCNLNCPFCQNHTISRVGAEGFICPVSGTDTDADTDHSAEYISPKELADTAQSVKNRGNIGVAFTYNEPLIGYEYVLDTAKLVHEYGMKNVLVTNGSVSLSVLNRLLPRIDAMNIDLKAFTEKAYEVMGGDLSQTKAFIEEAVKSCHVELTSLIVPGLNDRAEEMEAEAVWISSLSPEIPLHITRFFPMYRMKDRAPTDVALLYALKRIAEKHLKYVYVGNV